ncbi:MAG: 50S ribosomal protein L4 [Rhodovibrionaceae bacterium]
MKLEVTSLDAKQSGTIDLDETIFGLEPRKDLLARVVNWQLARRRAGTHKTKGRSEVSGTSKKAFRQKGTGRARRGNMKTNLLRGGGTAHGPTPRDHAFDLPKRLRKLALKVALSAKVADGKLVVIDEAKTSSHKTKELAAKFGKLGFSSVLIIDGAEFDEPFARAARNIPGVDLMPQEGANVYDILRRDTLVLTKGAVEALEARLK